MISISIVIVNYNVKELLLQCLRSLKKFVPANFSFEIIVIDNNSADESCNAIRSEFTDVILIENKFNNGFSGANNQGIEIAKGEIIFLLNPDTELIDDSLIALFNFIQTNKSDIIAAPKLLNSDNSFQNSCYRFPTVGQIILESFFLHSFINIKTYKQLQLKQQTKVDALSGAALIFKKDLIASVGMLDENLFWMEDIDFCYRNVMNGGTNIYLPQAVIKHHSGQSAKKNFNVAISNQIISKIKYIHKYHGNSESLLAVLFSYFHIITRIIIFGALSLFPEGNFPRFKAYLFTFKKLTHYLISGNNTVT